MCSISLVFRSGGIASIILAGQLVRSSSLTVEQKSSLLTVIARRKRNEQIKPEYYSVDRSLRGKCRFPFPEEAMATYRRIPVGVDSVLISAIQHTERGHYGVQDFDCIYHLLDDLASEFPTEFATLTSESLRTLLYRACRPPRIASVTEEGFRSALKVFSCVLHLAF